jgi:BON domain
MLDAPVPAGVDATVGEGIVTLHGAVEHRYERDEGIYVAGNVSGVVAIENQIQLIPSMPDAPDIQHSIKKAFERDPKLEAERLDVETCPGTVTLKGNVRSVYERDAAVAAARPHLGYARWTTSSTSSADQGIKRIGRIRLAGSPSSPVLGELLPGRAFDEYRDEVADRAVVEPVVLTVDCAIDVVRRQFPELLR